MSEIKEIRQKIVDYRILNEKNGKISQIKKERPNQLKGSTYALKSSLLKNTLYITINDIEKDGKRTPFEIFFNTRDTAKFVELQIITRLISAIFRRSENSVFVIDELKAVANPENTGYFRAPREGESKGKYIPSIFYEIGEVIEEHFISLGFKDERLNKSTEINMGADFLKCPKCDNITLRREGGCDSCLSCGYSKCG